MKTIFSPDEGIRTDLFDAIKYENRPGTNGNVQGIQFPRRFVLRWMFEVTWGQVSAGVIAASPYRFYYTEQLFANVDLWAKYDADMHRVFGRCLAYFTNDNHKMLPLNCLNPHRSNRLYYKIVRPAVTDACAAHALPMVCNFHPTSCQWNSPCQS